MTPPAVPVVRLLPALLPALLALSACTGTPNAADLVAQQSDSGPRVSQAEAAAALLDYVDATNRALRSGDTDDVAAMTGPQCPCRDLVALIEERFTGGASLVGASFDAGNVTVLGRGRSQAQVRARVSVSEYGVRNRDGLRVGTRPAQEYLATYTVRRDGDSWQVVDVRPAS